MNFSAISSLNAYTKRIDMKQKVDHRKKTGNYKADGITTMSNYVQKKREDDRRLMESLTQNEDGTKKDTKLSSLRTKYMNGGKLTYEEKQYISSKDPQLYASIKEAEAEAEAYERDIKRARTKEDVQRVDMNHTAKSLSKITSVKNNPNIPEGAKLAVCAAENQKMTLKRQIKAKFIASGEFDKLPTEQEERQAEKEIREAREAEIQTNPTSEYDAENTAENSGDMAEAATDKTGASKAPATEHTHKTAKPVSDAEHTRKNVKSVSEAEHTEEAEKVRKAKYKKAAKKYAANMDLSIGTLQSADKAVDSPSPLDVQG